MAQEQARLRFRIHGMDCAEEVAVLKREVGPVVGGEGNLAFDILNGRMTVAAASPATAEAVTDAVARTGMRAEPWRDEKTAVAREDFWERNRRTVLTAAGAVLLVLAVIAHSWSSGVLSVFGLTDHAAGPPWTARLLYVLSVLASAWTVLPKAWNAAKRLRPDMNLLMTIAVAGALALAEWLEAASVAFLFALSLALEAWSVGRARRAVAALMDLTPPAARLLREGGREELVPPGEVPVGARFLVRPGDRIPLDGRVVEGAGGVDQSPITGESVPVQKGAGDEVFAGTINGDGLLTIESTKAASDTTLARIIRMVGEAQSRRAPSEQWVERFARYYTPAVMALALAVLLVPPLLFGGAWGEWVYRSLVLLVIACPCALVISTPVSIVAALAAAARNGVLVKGGVYVEAPARLKAIAFDKTGTLTEGKPAVVEVVPLGGQTEADLLSLAASLETRSTHPIAHAIVTEATRRGLAILPAEAFRILPGKGAEGRVGDTRYWLGSHRYLEERGQETPDVHERLESMTRAGRTVVVVGKDVAEVGVGSSIRTGASTEDGEEALVGGAIMLMGENSRLVARAVREKLADIQGKLPEGVEIVTGYDRSDLVSATIRTVQKNLFEGAVLVVVILFAMLGNWRAAVIVALTIPLSMLFAITGMVEARISGNLMSLGAIDFGMIIDGSVVMVENILRHLAEKQHALGRRLTAEERLREVLASGREVANPMFFGVLIITIVYVPILALTGIEGKMFRPMAATVIFALVGALLVALTVMPVLCALLLGGDIRETDNAVVVWFKRAYQPILMFALRRRLIIVGTAVVVFASSLVAFSRLGAEFMPQLDEGSLLVQMIRSTSISLDASLGLQMRSEKVLLEHFPEVVHTFSKLGTAEIATDPMGPNVSDTFVLCRPEAEWRREGGRPISKEELIERMRRELTKHVPGQTYLFTQPIQMRFNEIMAGARADIAVKIFGDEFEEMERLAGEVRDALRTVPGGGDVEFEAIGRTPMLEIVPDREAMRRLNVHAEDLNATIRGALGGLDVGTLVEGNRRYPVLVRLAEDRRRDLEAIKRLPVRSDEGGIVPLGVVATLQVNERVGSIAREANQRRVAILINLRGRDVEGFVTDAVAKIKEKVKFPEGYYFEFGGQFENLQEARRRLSIVVPLTLLLIFGLIFLAFDSVRQALLIFLCVPLAMTGGVLALVVRGMPFSISAAVGFIALSGIAVLNGLMLISFINQLREQGRELRQAVVEGALTRLRPKLMTAFVASLGFVPMAIATGSGAEVQRPLATVVIGGVLSSTFLTLVLLPTLYEWIERRALERQPATDCSQE